MSLFSSKSDFDVVQAGTLGGHQEAGNVIRGRTAESEDVATVAMEYAMKLGIRRPEEIATYSASFVESFGERMDFNDLIENDPPAKIKW